MKIYQALLPLLLSLTSNCQAQSCDVCDGNGDFDPDQQVNATATCADLGVPDDVEDGDELTCTLLQFTFLFTSCCSGGSNVDCSICGEGTLTNPEFAFEVEDGETGETETTTCREYDASLVFVGALGSDSLCELSAAAALSLGCKCEGGPPPAGNNDDCSLCGDGTLKNPEFAPFEFEDVETAETETVTCGEADASLALFGAFGLDDLCDSTADTYLSKGCQCEGSPAAHANVKIASLIVVGATFMASFFF
jgi:hypothetical protein